MINPYDFVKSLTTKLSKDAIVVCANGTACVTMFQAGVVKKGQRFIWNNGCASMGYTLPASIGAAFASGREVICLEGDGSIMMSIQSLQTIKHYDLPIKIFLLNNNGYSSIQQTHDNFLDGNRYGCDLKDLSFPDWQDIAHTFKLKYYQVNSKQDLDYHIDDILYYEDGPVLCEVVLGDYKFRKEEL